MKRARDLFMMLLFVTSSTITGCTSGGLFPADNDIDPSGNLKRSDYIDLRHREEMAQKAEQEAEPPIPEMPAEAAEPSPPVPGNNKLVSVAVTDSVPVRDVLIDLAREASVNLELDPRIQGGVIFSAHDQPFDEVLQRICNLAGLRAKQDGPYIRIELDEPYQENYHLDYLSLARKTTSETAIATNVFDVDVANGGGVNGVSGSYGGGSNGTTSSENNSTSKIDGTSNADFWSEVDKSLGQILAAGAAPASKNASASAATFSIDRQAGMVTVYANSRQQAAIAEYFRELKKKAYAQVLIDARIIEVELDDTFKSGIDWRTLFGGAFNAAAQFGPAAVGAPFLTATTATPGVFTASINDKHFADIINLVRSFGTTRVLSAPRLTVLNNQTAVLKVATNEVYFVTQAQFTTVTNANGSTVTTTPVYTSTPHTVPVGLVMTVQPAIDADHDRITMTLRPTISRVVDTVDDPSIGLNAAEAGVANPIESKIPELAVREMDSVIQLHSGEIAVMGGLMQDSSINTDAGVPPFDAMPVIGNLAKSRDNEGTTTELVILLRATITEGPPADFGDRELYYHYNNDPRPWPLPMPPALSHAAKPSDARENNDKPTPSF